MKKSLVKKDKKLHKKIAAINRKEEKLHKAEEMVHKKEDKIYEKASKGKKKVEKVMKEFKEGKLHSGSKKGPQVTNPKQAIAIALSEERRKKRRK
jgi:hypothetical protein